MSASSALYFAAILLIGVPSAFRLNGRIRNATALAMVATWLFCRILYALTGEGMPLQGMVLSDMIVIGAIYAKDDWQDCTPYKGLKFQLCALWLERSPWDRAIMALFPLAWLFYAPIVSAQLQYWTLYGIGIAQLTLAGREALDSWLRAHGHKLRAVEKRPRGLRFAAWGQGYG